mmetsp:Transcript_76399/g.212227  ORF Transcript_76399/g.212227 Transcript_76399/m.212227 type:complete len:493 (-) Transcript_76399:171-1649(-)
MKNAHRLCGLSWFGILAFRLLQSLLVRTFFDPDEFWQAHEVAHQMAYGCGHLTWEWSRSVRLRCPLHPAIFAAAYRLLGALGLDSREAIASAPRVMQAAAATWADIATFDLAARVHGPQPARWALFCQLANWFNGYCLVRPYSNSLEAVLTTVSLARFVREEGALGSWLYIAAAACILRPTSAVMFIVPWLAGVAKTASPLRHLAKTLGLGIVAICAAVCIDSAFYGELTWSFVSFFRFNVVHGGAALYGKHHALWYLTEGIPAVVGTMLPLLLCSAWRRTSEQMVLSITILVALFLYSLQSHKELRFLLPVLPLLMAFAGAGLWQIFVRWPRSRRPVLFLLVGSNSAAFLYLGLWHQRAPMACVEHLASERASAPDTFSVDFLTPCHATPYFAHLHFPGQDCPDLRFLDCSPQWREGRLTRSQTDSAQFALEGSVFLGRYYDRPGSRWPLYIVVFEEAWRNASSVLQAYEQVGRFENNIEDSRALILLRRR